MNNILTSVTKKQPLKAGSQYDAGASVALEA